MFANLLFYFKDVMSGPGEKTALNSVNAQMERSAIMSLEDAYVVLDLLGRGAIEVRNASKAFYLMGCGWL